MTLFVRNNNHYVNSAGMEIGLSKELGIWTYLNVIDYDEGPLKVSITTEEDSPKEFIVGFKIESWKEIDKLDYTSSWMRYLNGAATITIRPMELEADISFKIVKFKTIIFSLDMHFYDEVYEHLTIPEDFQKYIDDHERKLFSAKENRYKISRR